MTTPIEVLLSKSGNALKPSGNIVLDFEGDIINAYASVLAIKNGFYAFEDSLHFYDSEYFNNWNNQAWIKKQWTKLAPVFFAEDLFGIQFAIYQNKVFSYDPESGELEFMSNSLEEWAGLILEDPESLCGSNIGLQWSKTHGSIPKGKRLAPKVPFILGGDYTLESLYIEDSYKLSEFRFDLMVQIKNSPDGTKVSIKFSE